MEIRREYKHDIKIKEIQYILDALERAAKGGLKTDAVEKLSKLLHKRLNHVNDFVLTEYHADAESPVNKG